MLLLGIYYSNSSSNIIVHRCHNQHIPIQFQTTLNELQYHILLPEIQPQQESSQQILQNNHKSYLQWFQIMFITILDLPKIEAQCHLSTKISLEFSTKPIFQSQQTCQNVYFDLNPLQMLIWRVHNNQIAYKPMAHINISNVIVHNTPSPLNADVLFEVTFECLHPITGVLDWKLMFIGAKKDQSGDQVLSSFEIGPISPGVMKFNIQSPPPNYSLIPAEALSDVTAFIISTSYHNQEFFRLGYYVRHEYVDEQLKLNPPQQIQLEKLQRVIIVEKPIITKPQIDWEDISTELVPGDQTAAAQLGDPFNSTSGVFDQLEGIQIAGQNPTNNWNYGMVFGEQSA